MNQTYSLAFIDRDALLKYIQHYSFNTIGSQSPLQLLCTSDASFNSLLEYAINHSGLSIVKDESDVVHLNIDRSLEETQAIARFEHLASRAYGSSLLERAIREQGRQSLPLLHSILFATDFDWLDADELIDVVSKFQSQYNPQVDYHWLFTHLDFSKDFYEINHSSVDILNAIKALEAEMTAFMLNWKAEQRVRYTDMSELAIKLFEYARLQNAHSRDEEVKAIFNRFYTLQSTVSTHCPFEQFKKLKKPMNLQQLYHYIVELRTIWADIVARLASNEVEPWYVLMQTIASNNYALVRELHQLKSKEDWNSIVQYTIDKLVDGSPSCYHKATHQALKAIEVDMNNSSELLESGVEFQIVTQGGDQIHYKVDDTSGREYAGTNSLVFVEELTHSQLFHQANILAQNLTYLGVSGRILMSKDDISLLMLDAIQNDKVEQELITAGYKSLGPINYDILVESFVDTSRSVTIHHYKHILNCNDLTNPVQQARLLYALERKGVSLKAILLEK